MRSLKLTGLGGMKFTQTRLKWMQEGTLEALRAMAKLCGEKTIVTGVEVNGGNVSAGWIVYQGELVEFIAGSYAAQVSIVDTENSYTYANNTVQPVEVRRTAQCGVVGAFPFSDLVRLSSIQNIWKPGDLRMIYKDAAYQTANFDSEGYGLNAEKGWRIFSRDVPGAAGKMFINLNPADADFNQVGKTGGGKTKTLLPAQQGSFRISNTSDDLQTAGTSSNKFVGKITINGSDVPSGTNGASGGDVTVRLQNDAEEFNAMNPYFVILTLIKI